MTARIITFYSYKGGVGRSMALANVAWILASGGRRVLAVDWDLDAPGLHRYFRPFLLDPDLAQSPGLIDFLIESATGSVTRRATNDSTLLSYASSLEWSFPAGGRLDLVGAGRQDQTYALRASGFDWHAFYERLGGQELLERMKRNLNEYDFVLIDSRTGLSDMSRICIEQMPEGLVMCFGPNPQSIDGSIAVARSARTMRANSADLIPVLMRVDHGEKELLEQTRRAVRSKLFSLEGHWAGFAAGDCLEFPYVPYYAYKEILSVFVDAPFSRGTVRMAAEELAGRLARGSVMSAPEIPDGLRRSVLMAYDAGTTFVGGVSR